MQETTSPDSPHLHPVLILASASPRRAELLRTLAIPFLQAPCEVEEPRPEPGDEATPAQFVERLARFKAENCNAEAAPPGSRAVILAADTIVWFEGNILNKPVDEEHARTMLRRLRGKSHTVYTGVCLRMADQFCLAHEATLVQFGFVSDWWIDAYVATGEPLDKAGAYAAQGQGAILVEKIVGDFWNVVGLPLWRLGRMFEQIGIPIEDWWKNEKSAGKTRVSSG